MHQTKRKLRTGEKYNEEAYWIKKPVPTTSKHGMEPNM
jgi:hypothetical protein